MQTYLEPQLSDHQGRALWLSMFDEVKRQHLLAPALPRTLIELLLLLLLLGWFLALCWLVIRCWGSAQAMSVSPCCSRGFPSSVTTPGTLPSAATLASIAPSAKSA